MGEPVRLKAWHMTKVMSITQGTETSHYLQEKKEKSISGVVASETEEAQTGFV